MPRSPDKFQYRPLTEAEIRTLALDIHAGRIFGTWNIPKGEQAPFVLFLNLALASGDILQELADAGVVHIYEYLDQAGWRVANGYPCFFSSRFLNRTDAERVAAKISQIEKVLEQI